MSFPNPKIPGGYNFVNDTPDPMDTTGHGTHVASIAAGSSGINYYEGSNPAGEIYLEGAAPGAQLYAYKVCDSGGCPPDLIIKAIDTSIDPFGNESFNHHDIINMSLGGPGRPDTNAIAQAAANASNMGVVVVVAAGNAGPSGGDPCSIYNIPRSGWCGGHLWDELGIDGAQPDDYWFDDTGESYSIACPACAEEVITVGSSQGTHDFWDEYGIEDMSPFSSRGQAWPTHEQEAQGLPGYSKPDIVAPGYNICAAISQTTIYDNTNCINNNHMKLSGTSMAAPFVSGISALLIAAHPELRGNPEEVKNILKNGSVTLTGDTSGDELVQGDGRINALFAISYYEGENLETGCTQVWSCNYNPYATINDGSCFDAHDVGCWDGQDYCYYEDCPVLTYGCTDEDACNYDSYASHDDGSCFYAEGVCDCDGNVPEGFCNCVGLTNETVCGSIYKDCWNNCECFNDADGDGVCDQEDDCVGEMMACGCNIPMPDGACDCDGSIVDECGECGGPGATIYCHNSPDIICSSENCGDSISIDYDFNEAGLYLISFPFAYFENYATLSSVLGNDSSIVTDIIGQGEAAQLLDNGQWVGSLTELHPHNGYWLTVKQPYSFSIEGTYLGFTNYNLYNLSDLNLISYQCGNIIGVSSAFSYDPSIQAVIGQGVAAQYIDGLGWVGNLQYLEPGKGYWVRRTGSPNFSWNCTPESVMETYSAPYTQMDIPLPNNLSDVNIEDVFNRIEIFVQGNLPKSIKRNR